jgi:hypothetical protein
VNGLDPGVDDPDLDPAGGRERAQSCRVPAFGCVDVGVGGATGLAGVVESVELAEERIVGDRVGAQDQVRLGVGDQRRALESRGDGGRIAVGGEDRGARMADTADLAAEAEVLGERIDGARGGV